MLHPVMAHTALLHNGLLEEERVIGTMGHMAGVAVPILHRGMLILRSLRPRDRIAVACTAKLYPRPLQEGRLRRCVGSMAAQAALLGNQRPVQMILPDRLVDHFTMARPAQLETFFFGPEGVRGCWFFMTLVAHLVCDRLVNGIV